MFKPFLIFFYILLIAVTAPGQSWQEAKTTKKATLDLLWYESKPFVKQNADGQMIGLEVEILKGFAEYLKETHAIDLSLNWVKPKSFYDILVKTRDSEKPNIMGVSAFSITEERKEWVKYSSSYLPDITVLVSSQGTPIVQNFDKIDEMMEGMTAITIKGTTYEKLLRDLQEKLSIDFDITYISSDDNVLDHINVTPKSFGFIDLPIYLLWIKNGSPLVRQNFFTTNGNGYGFIMPKNSEWDVPFRQFMNTPKFRDQIGDVISRHIGSDIYEFIDNLNNSELLGTTLLTKEKEMHQTIIKNATDQLAKEESYRHFLLIVILLIVLFIIAISLAFFKINKSNKQLKQQKSQIETQQIDISHKNDQLMNRNGQLMELNEEKNYLINILAHDLRSPLTSIIGHADILGTDEDLSSEDAKKFFQTIKDSAGRMNQMISKILTKAVEDRQNKHVALEEVCINSLVHDLKARYTTIAQEKNIWIECLSHPERVIIHTDHLLLTLIVENLVSNAVKFSEANTTVSLTVSTQDKWVTLSVKDEGPGFSDKDKLLLFNKLQPLSAKPTGGESSTGLGLSIVKKYVADLNGNIKLESEMGQGSNFIVSMPRNNTTQTNG